jgi:hypothetical protein
MTQGPLRNHDVGRCRRISSGKALVRAVALVAATGALVALALWAHGRMGERAKGGPPPRIDVFSGARAPDSGPAAPGGDPLAENGLNRLEKDPADAFVPAGAVRRHAFRRALPDGAADTLTYLAEMDSAKVESFYVDSLKEAGYKLLRRGAGRDGAVTLVFVRDLAHQYIVTVSPAGEGTVQIVLVIARTKEDL